MKVKGNWADELPLALWTYRMTHKYATGHTLFALTYESKVMIPVELEVPSHRRTNCDPMMNEKLLLESFDMMDEKQKEADLRVVAHQKKMA